MNADLLELPFDQYQRYRLVADILKEVRPKGRRLSILDVGGRTALLRQFLPKDDVTAVDLESAAARVKGEGLRTGLLLISRKLKFQTLNLPCCG